jgi:hypothetical protein
MPPGPTAPVLVRVPDQDKLRIGLFDRGEELREIVGPGHPGLVEDHDAVAVEDQGHRAPLVLEEELRKRLGAHAGLLTQDLRRHRGGREPDRVVTRCLPCAPRGIERSGLSRSCGTDEERDALATFDESAHRVPLVLAEGRVREHPVDDRRADDGGVRVAPRVDAFEDRRFATQRRPSREAHCAVALDRRHAVSPSERRGYFRGERSCEAHDLRVGEHPLREDLRALAHLLRVGRAHEPRHLLDDL